MKTKGKILLLVLAVTLIVVGFWYNDIVSFLSGGEGDGGNNGSGGGNSSSATSSPNSDGEGSESVDLSLYFSRNRIERNASRSRLRETLETVTRDESAPDDVKSEAHEKIILLARQANTENQLEGLIRQRGFADVFVSFSDIGELEVIVNADSLNEEQVVQISEIIRRNTGVEFKDMSIRHVA